MCEKSNSFVWTFLMSLPPMVSWPNFIQLLEWAFHNVHIWSFLSIWWLFLCLKDKSKLYSNIHMVFMFLPQCLLTGLPPWILHSLPICPCNLNYAPLCIQYSLLIHSYTLHPCTLYYIPVYPCTLNHAFHIAYQLNFSLFPMLSQNFSCFILYAYKIFNPTFPVCCIFIHLKNLA